MKIRQAPVADLIKYFDELYEDRENNSHDHILKIVDGYYRQITKHKTIMPPGDDFMGDWCDLNHSTNMEICPNVPGTIIYKHNPDGTKKYGILYHSGYICPRSQQTDYMAYYSLNKQGQVSSHTYLASDWEGWGVPIRYFSFNPEDYQDSNVWELGERALEKDMFGHDVRQLQSLLKKAHPNLAVDGYFGDLTLKALQETYEWCNATKKSVFVLNSVDGKKVIQFLCGGKK